MNKETRLFEYISGIEDSEKTFALGGYFNSRSRELRIPLSASFEITPFCPLKCKMCYINTEHMRNSTKTSELISKDKWIEYAQQAKELGTIAIILTGGEAMMRDDFCDIYNSIYDVGMQIVVMSNATLVDDKVINCFRQRPPERVSVTLYGFSEDTYRRTCQVNGMYKKALNGIETLIDNRMKVTLKTTIIRTLVGDVPKIYNFAKSHNIGLKTDYILQSKSIDNAEMNILDNYSITDEQYIELLSVISDIDGIDYVTEIKKYHEQDAIQKEVKKYGMQCSAGVNTFAISWDGFMTPCLTLREKAIDLRKKRVTDAWEQIKAWADNVPQMVDCGKCRYRNNCRQCVALHYQDTGIFGKPSPRLCYKVQHNIYE